MCGVRAVMAERSCRARVLARACCEERRRERKDWRWADMGEVREAVNEGGRGVAVVVEVDGLEEG